MHRRRNSRATRVEKSDHPTPHVVPAGMDPKFYYGFYLPGVNDHGDMPGDVAFADADEVASLMQTDVANLSWIDHGSGRMVMRTDMQVDDEAPVNLTACKMLLITTSLKNALTIRGPIVNFGKGFAPPIEPLPVD